MTGESKAQINRNVARAEAIGGDLLQLCYLLAAFLVRVGLSGQVRNSTQGFATALALCCDLLITWF